jgi:glycosyltransferase involved in cell wall biosynthesis
MTRRSILHLATYLQGGAGRAVADLACAQRRLGHDVTVIASETGVDAYVNYTEYLDRLQQAGVTLWLCDSLFKRDLALNFRVLDMLRHQLATTAIDVVHAHAAIPSLIGRLFAGHAATRIPVVQTQHGWGTNKTPAQEAADLAILRDVDRVVTTSNATRDLLVGRCIPADSITVIPCGIDRDDAGPPPPEAERVIQPLRARGARVIGCIGSVTANKNQQLLVEALSSLNDLNAVAVFLGEGGDALVREAARRGVSDRVVACGYQPQASRWLSMMDLLVLPSRTEGQGLVVLEAFRAGVPVVVSHIPALADLVDEGRCGVCFEPDNAASLAEGIRHVVTLPDHERAAMTQTARARLLEEFTRDHMVARHEKLYSELQRPARGRRTRKKPNAKIAEPQSPL